MSQATSFIESMNSQQIIFPQLWQHESVTCHTVLKFSTCLPPSITPETLPATADTNRALTDAKLVALTPSQESYINFHYLEIQFFMPHHPQTVRIHTKTDVFLLPFTLTTAQFSKYSTLVRLLKWIEYVLTYSRVRTCAQVNKAV